MGRHCLAKVLSRSACFIYHLIGLHYDITGTNDIVICDDYASNAVTSQFYFDTTKR